LTCGRCGHNLHSASGRCPECGRAFDPERLIGGLIPWEQRRSIGWIRAYFRTVRLATFRPSVLARKVAAPVSYRSARLFRRITVGIAFATILLAALAARPAILRSLSPERELGQIIFNPWSFTAALVGVWLGLAVAASIISWPFHLRAMNRERRGRAVALSCYACAPLAWAPLIGALCGVTIWLIVSSPDDPALQDFLTSHLQDAPTLLACFAAGAILWCEACALIILRLSTRCGVARIGLAAMLLPFASAIVLLAGPAICELVLALSNLMIRSFS
jgi:hypothetical protein